MSFFAPIFLPLLALAGVPVLIHLLNRRRFQVVDWAPMKYLKLTIKSNRRRLRIEQLILLAIRTLMVILLIIAIARPVLSPTGMGAWLGGQGRTSRIIVIDDSLSMGYHDAGRTAFDAAREVAAQILRSTGAQDSLTTLTCCKPDSPLLSDIHLDDPARAIGEVNSLPLCDAASDWPALFQALDRLLQSATFPQKEIVLITDLRKSGWDGQVNEFAKKWSHDRVSLKVIDVGSRSSVNTALTVFAADESLALPNTPASLMAKIRNSGAEAIVGAQATLQTDAGTKPVMLPTLPPGETVDLPLTVTPLVAGQQMLKLSLPSDALGGDDVRYFALNVRPTLNVVLIDGEPSAVPFESETDFLALAYTIGAEPWHVTRVTESEWDGAKNATADVIILANVASLTPAQVGELERLVRGGTGIIIFSGELLDITTYNDRLYHDGKGLLPAKLDGATDGPFTGLVMEGVADSPLHMLDKVSPSALAGIKINRFMAVDAVESSRDVRVLARWNNSQNSPAVIEKHFGRGRVLLFTTTADKGWSDWPLEASFVLGARSAATSIARSSGAQDNIVAGEPFVYPLPNGETARQATVKLPDGTILPARVVPKTDASPSALRFEQTTQAGNLYLNWKDSAGQPQQRLVCVSPALSESNLEPISDQDLTALLEPLDIRIVHYAGESSLSDKGHEIWRTLALLLLALAGFETLFAVWVGRER